MITRNINLIISPHDIVNLRCTHIDLAIAIIMYDDVLSLLARIIVV
jgi:hypothetical protein